MPATDLQVREAFIELTDTLVRDFDIADFLDRLAVRCTELLDVSACGILLVGQHGVLNLVGASRQEARLLELSQLQNSEGPCLDAYRTGRPVQRANLADADPRWPRFAAAARAAGFAAVQALPMRLREQRLGAVNLFNTVSGPLAPDTIALGQALADAATIGIVHQRTVAATGLIAEQLQGALDSRVVIEQAKGYLAERFTVAVEDAFTMMRAYARRNRRKLSDVAADIVDGRVDLAAAAAAPQAPPRVHLTRGRQDSDSGTRPRASAG
jgi:ANTAR domain-containing protein/GAF domain-containing protein